MNDSLSIDGFGPLQIHRPATPGEVGSLVREAAANGQAVYPVGGGTHLDIGLPPTKPGIAIHTGKLNRLIDYPARDMTITVEAGMTVRELQATLAKEHQYLPIDFPGGDAATVGGVLATNRSGSRRLGHGTLRDYVIGITIVDDGGREIHGGGRVVKNVAGYDLMKLHIGALGTLGIITQVTFKVKPRPESSAIVGFGVEASEIAGLLDRIHDSTSRPIAIELLNASALKQLSLVCTHLAPRDENKDHLAERDEYTRKPWVIACGFEEKRTTVDWQINTLVAELGREVTTFRDERAEAWIQSITNLQMGRAGEVCVKVNALPSQTATITTAMQAAHARTIVHAHAGNGIVFGHFDVNMDGIRECLEPVERLVQQLNANVIVTHCATATKTIISVWGRNAGERDIMKAIQQQLDPQRLFNPGRMG